MQDVAFLDQVILAVPAPPLGQPKKQHTRNACQPPHTVGLSHQKLQARPPKALGLAGRDRRRHRSNPLFRKKFSTQSPAWTGLDCGLMRRFATE